MGVLEGICNEKLPDPKPGDPLLGEECSKAEKNASGECKGFLIKGSREPFFACSICEEKAKDPEEAAESSQESGGNIGGHSAIGGHNMQNNGSRGAGGGASGRDSAGNRGQRAPT